ncbi:MAG: hypothetical protein L6Q54_05870 [Leptospiraceae bacterium]|nr:hypothetical protein [Leptospiraceae bacterium]MCK6380764.1 hypothetical protein [Leptospiraceae bacterium]NUM41134.1 hypothetical protein [Leptospiraceae bacterium]
MKSLHEFPPALAGGKDREGKDREGKDRESRDREEIAGVLKLSTTYNPAYLPFLR